MSPRTLNYWICDISFPASASLLVQLVVFTRLARAHNKSSRCLNIHPPTLNVTLFFMVLGRLMLMLNQRRVLGAAVAVAAAPAAPVAAAVAAAATAAVAAAEL